MSELNCNVWLLTEVSDLVTLDGYTKHQTTEYMDPSRKKRWAAILSRARLEAKVDPHPASALARVDGLQFCSSILPWRSCGARYPWNGARHADKTKTTIDELLRYLPRSGLIWGGDWNHALSETEYAGSAGGRSHIMGAVARLGLEVPTAALPHRLPNLLSIDHIAVPKGTAVVSAERVVASAEWKRLSDHDAYVVEIG